MAAPPDWKLVRVLPAQEQPEGPVVFEALELHDEGFVLRWNDREGVVKPQGLSTLSVRDSLGTPYKSIGVSQGPGPGTSIYEPALPEAAAWIEFLTAGRAVRFDVGGLFVVNLRI
jgi:hypothetical protein